MAQNDPTFLRNPATVSTRDAEMAVSGQFAGGTNYAASNAGGVGIATANGQCKLDDWTVEDQHEAARDPQQSQHIGGNGLGAGLADGAANINSDGVDDFNDTVSLTVEATGWVRNSVA